MRSSCRRLFTGISLGLVFAVAGCAEEETQRSTELAFDVTAARFLVNVQVGAGPAFVAVLDTGSPGLRVARAAVRPGDLDSVTAIPVHGSFHGGLVVDGVVGTATVTLGGISTERPIAVELVDSASCSQNSVGCDAASIDQAAPFFGYPAILGIGLRVSKPDASQAVTIGSPIAQLPGTPAFVVSARPLSDKTPGIVAIGEADTSAFKTYQLPAIADRVLPNGVRSWDDTQVPTCVTNSKDSALSGCAGGLLDTGNPVVQVELPGASTMKWASGTNVGVTIGDQGSPLASYSYTIASSPTVGVDATQTDASSDDAPLINLGTSLFLRYEVLFDPANGIVGLK